MVPIPIIKSVFFHCQFTHFHYVSSHILFLLQFIYLGFYVTFNTVQVISRQVVRRAEETSTHNWSRFCTVN